jgi:hypothetical protein
MAQWLAAALNHRSVVIADEWLLDFSVFVKGSFRKLIEAK